MSHSNNKYYVEEAGCFVLIIRKEYQHTHFTTHIQLKIAISEKDDGEFYIIPDIPTDNLENYTGFSVDEICNQLVDDGWKILDETVN